MWMIELATKTITADSRIGIQSDITGTIGLSSLCGGGRLPIFGGALVEGKGSTPVGTER
jgi:hypothetical protein